MVSDERNVGSTGRISPLVWVIVCILLLCQVTACFLGRGPALGGRVDLRPFYATGTMIRDGHGSQIYDYDYQDRVQNAVVSPRTGALPFLYPSFAALPFVPLSLLSYRAAFFVWSSINVSLLFFAAFLLRPWLPYFRSRGRLTLPALFCCLFGVSVALMQGQISFVLLLIYCGTWVLLCRERNFSAGLFMSIALIKFQIAIPIVLLFFIWKKWRFVSGFAVGALGLAAVSLVIVGKVGTIAYWHSMSGMTKQTALNAAAAKTHYGMFPVDMPNLHGLTFGLSHGAGWGLVLNVILCCVVLGFAARQRGSLLIALPAAMLVSYHMQPHDLTLLLLPLSFEVDELIRQMPVRGNSAIQVHKMILAGSIPMLILPLATILMGWGMNYVVSLAVCGIMVAASMKPFKNAGAESFDVEGAASLA